MDVPRDDLLAGARLAADQHRGVGTRNLFGTPDGRQHHRVARDHRVTFSGRRLQHRRDQFRVRRQWQEVLRTIPHSPQRLLGPALQPACNDGDGDPFVSQRPHEAADVLADLAQHKLNTCVATEIDQASHDVVRLIKTRATGRGDHGRLAELAGQRPDDQDTHCQRPRSALTISVIVTPSLLSATITTSPRATRRLLT